MMTREEAYAVLAEELEPIVAFHAGDYNAWKQNNRGRPGITVAAEKLHAIKETIEARKLARLACTPDQIKAYCLANHWLAYNARGYTLLRYRTVICTEEVMLPDSPEYCLEHVCERDFNGLIDLALQDISRVEIRPVADVIQAIANYKEEDQ